MIQTRNRFQYEVATGRATLPVVSTLTLILWVISTPHLWANIGSLLIFSLTTYLLLETDTKFALIRTRTTLPASFFFCFMRQHLSCIHGMLHYYFQYSFFVCYIHCFKAMNLPMLRLPYSMLFVDGVK